MPLQLVANGHEAVDCLFEAEAAGFTRPNAIWFSGGVLSPGAYIDNRVLQSYPDLWDKILGLLLVQVKALRGNYDGIASIESGGVPHGVALARLMQVPHFSVKKQEKSHGRAGLIGGNPDMLSGMKLLVIEDMSSTFGSVLRAMRPLESAGAQVAHVLMLTTWNLPEFRRNIEHYSVFALCGGLSIVQAAAKSGRIDSEYQDILLHWLEHPEDDSWSKEGGWIIPEKVSE